MVKCGTWEVKRDGRPETEDGGMTKFNMANAPVRADLRVGPL
jgi:hypothetical protein